MLRFLQLLATPRHVAVETYIAPAALCCQTTRVQHRLPGHSLILFRAAATLQADDSGGAVYLNNAPAATLAHSVFERNMAQKGDAGAVLLFSVGLLDMTDIIMRGNKVRSVVAGLVLAWLTHARSTFCSCVSCLPAAL